MVVINEAMADQFWPDGNPLEDRIAIGRGVMQEFADEPERQIIGVVANIRDGGLNNDPRPMMYVPQGQLTDGANGLNLEIAPIGWITRTQTSAQALSQAIQEELQLVRSRTSAPWTRWSLSLPPDKTSTCG